ncbi:hypothetical protein [Roseimaritima ulvae]|uniref:Uncharacterized protein n=1 Tax=Roseimaritima ulvae TaxID=980254 RepID=A0A5B9QPM3_9BACT|nr:hypothetical protein [Roseimaritima ulvae]QEG39852.1 hypothetical protein UC8_18510 [Roseimaritima ulvae]
MHASGKFLSVVCCSWTLAVISGCRTPQADGSIQVTQRPTGAVEQAEVPRTRLAYSKKLPTDDTSAAQASAAQASAAVRNSATSQGSATASISDDGQSLAVQPASAQQPSKQEQQQLLEAFRDADPRVLEAARRRMHAAQQADIEVTPLPDLPTRAELDHDPFAAEAEAAAIEAPFADNQSQFVMPASHSESTSEAADARRPAAPSSPDAPTPTAVPLLDSDSVTEQLAAGNAAHTDADSQPSENTPKTSNTPEAAKAVADAAPQWSEQKLLSELSKRFAELPEDGNDAALLRHHIRYRTLLMLSGRIDEALEPVEGMGSSEQEYLRNQLLALWTAIDPQGHPVPQRRWSAALPHLREATSHMAAATGTLEVRSLAFCTEVESFGRITPFESTRFQAGQQVILYSEVDGFAAERLSTGYETQFQGSYEIFDASGKRLFQRVLPADQQICNNYRRDYFIGYIMHLPSQLAAGKYRLELTLEDMKGKKYGQSSIDFEITGSVSKPHAGS